MSERSKNLWHSDASGNDLPPTLGIIGGGQLSRMLCLAAAPLGIRTVTLEKKADCPAAAVSHQHLVGNWNDVNALRELAAASDLMTLENEFVDAEALATLETEGTLILPTAKCLRTIQDKLVQKQALQAAGLATPQFRSVETQSALTSAAESFGFPFVLKRRRDGYDGKGNFTVRTPDDLEAGWRFLNGEENPLFAEAFCDFRCEIAVMVCRAPEGQSALYPVVETIQKDHICHVVKAPADIDETVRIQALQLAEAAVKTVDGIGSIGVEMFLTVNNELLINELAPRVHNSGHYSIEACHTSQFENHVRAICGLPLGNTDLILPAAVMINLLGDAAGTTYPSGVPEALKIDGVHLHLYGKDQSQVGRKMGHLTVLGQSVEEVLKRAQQAAQKITYKPEEA